LYEKKNTLTFYDLKLIDYIERNTFVPRPKPREPLKPEEIAEEPAGSE